MPIEIPEQDQNASDGRPRNFGFDIASSMLESLGINMYTSIGKSLSEFVANAYDADATEVTVQIPFESIEQERTALRSKAKEEVESKKRDKFTVLNDPLPGHVEITIHDNGHGMSPADIKSKLLIVSRNRRKDGGDKSESGTRYVMGRKGLGKLAGFGTAGRITIRSKRSGESFATSFTMDYDAIKNQDRVNQSLFDAIYFDDQPVDEHGTTITLSNLRCDSLRASEQTIRDSLSQNFSILGETFAIILNKKPIEEIPADYEFIYPADDTEKDAAGFATKTVEVGDIFKFDIRYLVKFRARVNDPAEKKFDDKGRELQRGNLLTAMRGARIYCNRRLAEGPSLLQLDTGMHNFHSQAYMECIVHADDIDKHKEVDHIGTNRADLKSDSEVVNALHSTVTEIMRLALYAHSKYRDEQVKKHVEQDEFTKNLLTRLDGSSKNVKDATKKLLSVLATTQGVKSDFYKNSAPLVLQSMNAGAVLANLIKIETDPQSMSVVAHELAELARVETRDVLRLYRSRRHGIEGLRKLIEQARANWKKGKRFENDLHKTLKENPWLIDPDFSRYLTSDKPLGDVARGLADLLKIDEKAPEQKLDDQGHILNEDTRPDLVFAMCNPSMPTTVTIVELKTPNHPLRIQHLMQLEGYMMNVEKWLISKYDTPVSVKGILIGDTDPESQSQDVQLLNKKHREMGALSPIEIVPLPNLLERAKKTHLDAIDALEKDEEFYDAELSVE